VKALRLFAVALAASAVLESAPAYAQLVQGADLTTNDYNIDLYQGPVLASTRTVALAGAYVAIAEGTDGFSQNPATPAVRVPYSFDHFDYDLGLGFSVPTVLRNSDFYNTGQDRTNLIATRDQDILFLNLAASIQLGSWGFGLSTDLQQHRLSRSADPGLATEDQLRGQFAVAHVLVAKAFADGQLVIGAGVRSVVLSVIDPEAEAEQERFSTEGAGLESGVLWRPNGAPFRVGAAVRSAVRTKTETPGAVLFQGTPDQLFLPNEVTVPWDLNLGLALQIGPRPLNPAWIDPSDLLLRVRGEAEARERARERLRERLIAEARRDRRDLAAAEAAIDSELSTQAALDEIELEQAQERVDRKLRERYALLSRSYLLVTTALLITGPAENAVGTESFLQRKVNRSGERVVLSPRLGLETEAVPGWLKVRAGTYGEPTRFETPTASGRLHGTLGFELKLFPWTVFGLFHESTVWQISAALDGAERYLNAGVGIGVWH
jgi:hypothetical protein